MLIITHMWMPLTWPWKCVCDLDSPVTSGDLDLPHCDLQQKGRGVSYSTGPGKVQLLSHGAHLSQCYDWSPSGAVLSSKDFKQSEKLTAWPNVSILIALGPIHNEHPPTRSKFFCIKIIDSNVKKISYYKHPPTTSSFLCNYLFVLGGTQCLSLMAGCRGRSERTVQLACDCPLWFAHIWINVKVYVCLLHFQLEKIFQKTKRSKF